MVVWYLELKFRVILGLIGNNTSQKTSKRTKGIQDLMKNSIYLTTKLHKHPSKAIVAPQCPFKHLHKSVTSTLKLMYQQIETYDSKTSYFSEVKTF